MNKKIIFSSITLVLIISMLGFIAWSDNIVIAEIFGINKEIKPITLKEFELGATEKVEIDSFSKENTPYKKLVDKKVVGFEKKQVTTYYDYLLCDWELDNKTGENITSPCQNVTSFYNRSVDDKTKPIYKESYPYAFEIKDKEYNLSRYNGFICGNYLLQVDKHEGGLFFEYVKEKDICKDNYPNTKYFARCYNVTSIKTGEVVESNWGEYCE